MSLFSVLGKIGGGIVGGLLGGPAGAAAGFEAGGRLLGGKSTPATPGRPSYLPAPAINVASIAPQSPYPQLPVLRPDSVVVRPGVTIPGLYSGGGSTTTYYPPAGGGAAAGPGKACPAGYHWNRTSYFTKRGFVAKGTACVKNRRRNPLNPRALSRSMSRIVSAKKAAHFLDRIHFGAPHRRAKACPPTGKR